MSDVAAGGPPRELVPEDSEATCLPPSSSLPLPPPHSPPALRVTCSLMMRVFKLQPWHLRITVLCGVQQSPSPWEISRKQCRLVLISPKLHKSLPAVTALRALPVCGQAVIKKRDPQFFTSRLTGRWAQRTAYSHEAGHYLLSIKHPFPR